MEILNPKDHIVIVCSHSNTLHKKNTLLECLNSVKNLGFDTILVSHFPEDKDVYTNVTHFIFDSVDPVIEYPKYVDNKVVNFIFYENEKFRIDWIPPFVHDYAVFTNLKNGVILAKNLNKKFVHIIEYDCLVDKEVYITELVNPLLDNYDLSYSIWDINISHLMAAYMFSFKLEAFFDLFNSIDSKESYFNSRIYSWQIERVLYDYKIKKQLKAYLNNYPLQLMNKNSISQQTNFIGEIRPCANEFGELYINIQHKLKNCLMNIIYDSFNRFINIPVVETIKIGNYRQGKFIKIFLDGRTIFDKELVLPLEEFYLLNKLREKKEQSFYQYINDGFSLGMRQDYGEFEEFCKFLSDKNIKNILEIGTDKGGSFLVLSKISNKNGLKISIDLPHASYGLRDFDINQRNKILNQLPGKIYLIDGDSHTENIYLQIKTILNGEKFDLIFIDGDHSFNGVKKDFEMYIPLLKEDGIIAFHDITYPRNENDELINVWEFWNMLDGDKKEFTSMNFWGGIGVVIKNKKLKFNKSKVTTEATINYHFINGAFCEVLSNKEEKYSITFSDVRNNKLIYRSEINNNCWSRCDINYFVPFRVQVSNLTQKGLVFDQVLNLTNKNVYIVLDSKSLGDTIAWVPYVEEFRQFHKCNVVCSSFWNSLFKKEYPAIKFVEPGTVISDLHAMYEIGWFENCAGNKNPIDPRTVPLQKIASDILGLEFKEIKTKISRYKLSVKQSQKYVCISMASTCQSKQWNYPGGWQIIVDYLTKKGLSVVVIQTEPSDLQNVTKPDCASIEDSIAWLLNCEFFVGLSSGNSWLAHSLDKHVIMIAGVTNDFVEFTSNISRVSNAASACHGCLSNSNIIFDKGDWNFCPVHKNTPRQFECTKTIIPEMVTKQIDSIMAFQKDLS